MPVANPDPKIDLDNYEFKENECLLYVPLYNTENGLFQGLGKRLGYITLRGDKNETFYSYGYDGERSKLLYCLFKQPIPNILQCTSFKKHTQYLLNERNKTLPLFTEMADHFEAFTDISEFNRYELMEVFTEGSLFRIFLHLFFL